MFSRSVSDYSFEVSAIQVEINLLNPVLSVTTEV